MKILEHNVSDNTSILRDATAEEIADVEISVAKRTAQLAEAEAKAQAKTELLDRLGITEDEAKLLLA